MPTKVLKKATPTETRRWRQRNDLTELEATILDWRHGITGIKYTLDEIATHQKCTRNNIFLIQQRGVQKLVQKFFRECMPK